MTYSVGKDTSSYAWWNPWPEDF